MLVSSTAIAEDAAHEETPKEEGNAVPTAKKEGPKKVPPSKMLPDPRGRVDLTICSQNLNNFGPQKLTSVRLGIDAAGYQEKQKAIAQRIISTKCDVVALQEVLSKSEEEGKEILKQLSKEIRFLGGRVFDFQVSSSNENSIRNGFLVAKDRAEIINSLGYSKVELPKISEKQKPRLFLRSPFEIQLMTKSLDEGKPKSITLINFHSKSKSGSAKDPTELEWETYRMEMSEAIRRIVEVRHRPSLLSSENLLVVLGDRNANFDLASAKILEGSLRLSDFMEDSFCRLSKRGVPLCKPGARSTQVLFSVVTDDPQSKLRPGTYTYKNVFSFIDDILLPAESLPFAWASYDKAGDYDSGIVYNPKAASDHAMVYVRLNW